MGNLLILKRNQVKSSLLIVTRNPQLECFLCRLLLKNYEVQGTLPKSMYGCIKCGKGFHVNCFTAFHFTKGLQGNTTLVNDVIRGITLAQENEKFRDKVSKYINKIEKMELYCHQVGEVQEGEEQEEEQN